AECSIEPPLRIELARAARGVTRVERRPAVLERFERGGRRELTAANREAQAVAGHRIDEARGVAGEQQSRNTAALGVDGKRTENRRRIDQTRVRKALPQQRITIELATQQRGRIAQLRIA